MSHAQYTRVYTDEAGETHFEEVSIELTLTNFAPPAAPLYIAPFLPAARTLWMAAPTDWAGDAPHPVPQRQVMIMLQGECEVTVSDGSVRRFPAGSVVLLEDTHGKGHATRITSPDTALLFGVGLA